MISRGTSDSLRNQQSLLTFLNGQEFWKTLRVRGRSHALARCPRLFVAHSEVPLTASVTLWASASHTPPCSLGEEVDIIAVHEASRKDTGTGRHTPSGAGEGGRGGGTEVSGGACPPVQVGGGEVQREEGRHALFL